jgi:hypothetical protein
MLSGAAVAFAGAGVALLSAGRGPAERWLGALLALLACVACVAVYGALRGSVVALTLAMATASALVLLLPQRPQRARPIAAVCATAGALLSALALR